VEEGNDVLCGNKTSQASRNHLNWFPAQVETCLGFSRFPAQAGTWLGFSMAKVAGEGILVTYEYMTEKKNIILGRKNFTNATSLALAFIGGQTLFLLCASS